MKCPEVSFHCVTEHFGIRFILLIDIAKHKADAEDMAIIKTNLDESCM